MTLVLWLYGFACFCFAGAVIRAIQYDYLDLDFKATMDNQLELLRFELRQLKRLSQSAPPPPES